MEPQEIQKMAEEKDVANLILSLKDIDGPHFNKICKLLVNIEVKFSYINKLFFVIYDIYDKYAGEISWKEMITKCVPVFQVLASMAKQNQSEFRKELLVHQDWAVDEITSIMRKQNNQLIDIIRVMSIKLESSLKEYEMHFQMGKGGGDRIDLINKYVDNLAETLGINLNEDALIKALKSEDYYHKVISASLLGRIRSKKSVDYLIKCLEEDCKHDWRSDLTISIAIALGLIEKQTSNKKALEALKKIYKQKFGNHIEKLVDSDMETIYVELVDYYDENELEQVMTLLEVIKDIMKNNTE